MERDQIAKAIKLYLDENYKNHITLSTITENFFISHSTACHYFKEEYSTTIKAYINKKRATGEYVHSLHVFLGGSLRSSAFLGGIFTAYL
jgi:YesN/AraC family two-component response regulator